MNLREIIDLFRSDVTDLSKKYLWSDQEIIGYANEAQEEACRRSLLLVDSTSAASEASLLAGESEIELHESVLYIRRMRIVGGNVVFPRVVRAMDECVPGWEESLPSTPMIFVPDWQSGYVKLYPPTVSAIDLKMTVIRLPMSDMVASEDEPEIPKRYHRGLLNYMKHLAYKKQDADTMDLAKAARFDESFTEEFGPSSSAKDEQWSREQYYDIGAN